MSKRILRKDQTQELIDGIENLLKLLRNHNLRQQGSLVGQLGELLVYLKILDVDNHAEILSGQSGTDIKMSNGCRIEVKTGSRSKTEGGIFGFGRIKPEKFHFCVCVALKEPPEFFIFSKKQANNLPTEYEARGKKVRYNGSEIEKVFHYYDGNLEGRSCDKLIQINKNIEDYQDWDQIGNTMK
jgi:hypothetical protein